MLIGTRGTQEAHVKITFFCGLLELELLAHTNVYKQHIPIDRPA